ncbi:EFR1 family ferrodoxin [Methanolacinia petrolearia]|uniref:EFR1 family ferrodoxin n=1 Tax=Methanolacinia petrolearia TaxID=54120 RepID=UPI003BAB8A95
MRTKIYYFTGTGNSLAVVRRIGESLGDCEFIPIASIKETEGNIEPGVEHVGIVCPVYDMGVPLIVKEFAGRIDLNGAEYCFAVVTMGGMGVSALHVLDKTLRGNCGKGLDSGFAIRMPANFPPLFKPPQGEKKDKILREADAKLDEIVGKIREGKREYPALTPLSSLFKILTYGKFIKGVRSCDSEFFVKDNCISCHACSDVCPTGNIEFAGGWPKWSHNCEMCFACLHFCPVEAIQWGKRTEGRGRYRHPDIRILDMKAQKGENGRLNNELMAL